jgi:inosose dehydratase
VKTLKIAGAPITWGVCEVPGWGYQLIPQRVLAEMRDVGLAATELGPEGFLPSIPTTECPLDSYGLSCVGPRAGRCTMPGTIRARHRRPARRAGGLRGQRSRAGGRDPHRRIRLPPNADDPATLLGNLDRLAAASAEKDVLAVLHPHVGTMVRPAATSTAYWPVRRSSCAWTPATC